MPLLTIDQGNSSAKLALWEGPTPIDEETFRRRLQREDIESLLRRFHPSKALVCSVTGNGREIVEWLTAKGVEATELSAGIPLPITLDYATPATLGADRIAAAVGAWSLFPGRDSLVVDMGTAVTYDVVTADGHFAGGNIAPGIGMRLRALRSFTARLPEVNGYGETPLFGFDTKTAMRAGAVRGVVSEINYYLGLLPEGTQAVLTGGWSKRVSELLDFSVTVDPALVTRGLLAIMLYNISDTPQP